MFIFNVSRPFISNNKHVHIKNKQTQNTKHIYIDRPFATDTYLYVS